MKKNIVLFIIFFIIIGTFCFSEIYKKNDVILAKKLIFDEISPNSGKQNEEFLVTIKGSNFEKGMIPFSREWGLSFVEIKIKDENTIEALVIIDDIAPPGNRKIIIASLPDRYSNGVDFTIHKNETLGIQKYKYGMYEDFNDEEYEGEEYDAGYDWQTDRKLMWWSTGHDQTYPVLTQENSTLKMWTKFDDIRGYWLSLRLKEPEGDTASENSVINIARSMSVDFYIPYTSMNWFYPYIGMAGRYYRNNNDGDHWRWTFGIWLKSFQENVIEFQYNLCNWTNSESSCEANETILVKNITYNSWINLRYDIFRYGDYILVIDFFVNNLLVARIFPKNAKFLLEECDWWRGPVRILTAAKPLFEPGITCFIDNIKSVSSIVPPFKILSNENKSIKKMKKLEIYLNK